jgi:hypothetical protein
VIRIESIEVPAHYVESLAAMASALSPASGGFGDLYLEGKLEIKHADGYTVGWFVLDGNWLLRLATEPEPAA